MLDEKTRSDPAVAPPKRWRNKWLGDRGLNAAREMIGPGIVWGATVYPSQEVAETKAHEHMQKRREAGLEVPAYLGAFPDAE